MVTVYGAGTLIGIGFLVAAFVAKGAGQPWFVAFPMLVTGIVMAPAFGMASAKACRSYTEVELRKIAALNL